MEVNPGKKAINIVYTVVTAESISRYEILSWVNNTLGTELEKVEELCTGAAYCRLVEHLFGPGTVQLKRVKFHTHLENDYFQNFKILQVAFNNRGVDKAIPIEKLVKGRYNDNYEFAQWFKMFYDANYGRRTDVAKPMGKPRNENSTKTIYMTEAERLRNNLKAQMKQAEVVRRPVTAAPALASRVQESVEKPFVLVTSNLSGQLRTVQRKVVELSKEVQNILEPFDAAMMLKDFYQTSLADIKTLCESEDAKESSNPEMAALLHRIFRVLKREPHAGTNKSPRDGTAAVAQPETVNSELLADDQNGPLGGEPKEGEGLRQVPKDLPKMGGDDINIKETVEPKQEKGPLVVILDEKSYGGLMESEVD